MILNKPSMRQMFPELAGTVGYDDSGRAITYHDRKASEIVKKTKDQKVTDGPTPVPGKKKHKKKPAPAPMKVVVHGGITVNGNVTIVNKTVRAAKREFVPASDPHEDALKFEDAKYFYGYVRRESSSVPRIGSRRRRAHQHA